MDAIAAPRRRLGRGLVTPLDPCRGRAAGPAPYRLLVAGCDLTAGSGVTTHDLGLLGHLARSLLSRTMHGVDVAGVPLQGRGFRHALRALQQQDLAAVDAVLLQLDVRSLRGWEHREADVRLLLRSLCDQLPRGSQLVLVTTATPPAALRRAVETTLDVLPRAAHLQVLPERAPSARGTYEAWAVALAAGIVPHLRRPAHLADPVDRLDDGRRAAAVSAMQVGSPAWDAALARLVRMAAAAYGTPHAALSVIDEDRTHYVNRHGGGTAPDSVDRQDSVCSTVLARYGGLVLDDAQAHEEFARVPVVADGLVRFYAGHRILDPAGTPVGVLCVYGEEPRRLLSQDIDVLRDIAAMVEQKIWQLGEPVDEPRVGG